jgi:ABC-2 type transport system ATP-binding protein
MVMEPSRTQSPSADAAVHLEGLGKDYGHFTALKSLDLTVREGTSLGFLGPNGAGKSTTIKVMTNLIRPSRGRALLFGLDARKEPTRALARVGAVIETPEFYGYLSPLETLAYAGRLRGMSSKEIERRSEDVLKKVKLSDWADHRIQEFSKGMKQRLAIAQALLNEPELLILDEPTSGLDPRGMAEVRDVIKALSGQGRTVFMSSHLLGEVQEVCDDVALLNHGELLIRGSVRDLSRGANTSTFQTTFLRPPAPQDLEVLTSVPGVEGIKDRGDSTVDVQISGGEEAQARVLEAMVARGMKVTTYRPLGSPLEQLYLDRIQESDRL